MKKLLLLGGTRYLLPVIETAKELGIYVITCDYLPDNVAHKHSDEYWNISIIDKDAVLKVAIKRKIDGVMSFACDPGVMTAAYIAEQMGLPFQCSYKSASILQDKGLFRNFLKENNFKVPHAKRYTDRKEPFNDLDYFIWPVIVKPVDSAGSKGVSKVDSVDCLQDAIDVAINVSNNGAYIIEDFLKFEGYHSSADPFSENGKIKFVTYSDQMFDGNAKNPYTPSLIVWPSSMSIEYQNELSSETQRLFDLLNIKTGIYNIETCVGNGGIPYLMEVSPRGGGCGIALLQDKAYRTNLIENEIRKAVGLPIVEIEQKNCDGHWCVIVLHANIAKNQVFKKIVIDPNIEKKYVKYKDFSVKEGDCIQPFTGANMSLGDVFLRFDSREELDEVISHKEDWLKIEFK